MTQQALADELGVSRSAIAMWEKASANQTGKRWGARGNLQRAAVGAGGALQPGTARQCDSGNAAAHTAVRAIAAGEPIFAEQSYETYVDVGGSVRTDFATEVQGDSMEPLYKNGDIVFIRKQDDVRDGRVAAVVIDDGATLKRVLHLPIGVQLMPINPAYEPMLFTAENSDVIRILGLAVGYFRRTV